MRKLVIGGVCLVLAAMSAKAADLREPYDPGFQGAPPPQAYLPPTEPEDEPPAYHPARPPAPPAYGYREAPSVHGYREAPSAHGYRGYREGPPTWREARPRDDRWDEPRWQEGRWHRHHHHDDDCRVRPTPWGPERVCR